MVLILSMFEKVNLDLEVEQHWNLMTGNNGASFMMRVFVDICWFWEGEESRESRKKLKFRSPNCRAYDGDFAKTFFKCLERK